MLTHRTRCSRAARRALVLTLFVALAGCGSGPSIAGTWKDPAATTTLPESLGSIPLHVDATTVFDDHAAAPTFEMQLALDAMGLTDRIDVHGTYVADGTNLTLDVAGFTIDPASGSVATTAADGAQCIALHGFFDTPVCFPAQQVHAYTDRDGVLTITLQHAIAGAPVTTTELHLTRAS